MKRSDVVLGLESKHVKTDVNGQQYYPSVEEVLSMLHADRTNPIERLVSGETHDKLLPRDYDHSPVDKEETLASLSAQEQFLSPYFSRSERTIPARDPEVKRISSEEQRIFDQEKLRSEVVGRSQPKLAFGDETKDITEGVLPTTMRRDSPSGSLSSLDSLDEVPDEVLEPAGAEPAPGITDNAVESIIRKTSKAGRGNRVTFNENVIFSDGFIGTLKRKVESDAGFGESDMEKQESYFKITTKEGGREKPSHGDPGIQLNRSVPNETNGETLNYSRGIPASSYPYSSSVRGSGATAVENSFSPINTAVVTPGGFTSQSGTNGVERKGLKSVVKETQSMNNTSITQSVNLPHGQNSVPRDIGGEHHDSSTVCHATKKSSFMSRNETGDIVRTTPTSSTGEYTLTRPNTMRSDGENYSEVNGVRYDPQYRSGSNVDRKTFETSNTRVPSSSINASILRDSLELNHEGIVNTPELRTQQACATHSPTRESRIRSTFLNHPYKTTNVEDTPETSLIPVTKKDFLSKALKRTFSNSLRPPEDTNSVITFDCSKQQESVIPDYGRTEELTNGNLSSSNFVSNTSDTTERNGYESNVYKQGYEYVAGNIEEVKEHNGMGEKNFTTIAYGSHQVPHTVNKKPFPKSQNSLTQKNKESSACNGTGIKNFPARGNIGTQKRNSAEDLLKSVQENIQKISMSPSERSISQTYGSTESQGGAPTVVSNSHRKKMVTDQRRKFARKKSVNRQKLKSTEEKSLNSSSKRLHRPTRESGLGTRKQISSKINIQYSSSRNDTQQYLRPTPTVTSVHDQSPSQEEVKGKQLKNREGLLLLDKTPTDEEINTLWETVRTCLNYEQSQKAASDSVVNNVRHSRSASGPLVGDHYLIDCNRWDYKPQLRMNAFGLNSPVSESRQNATGNCHSFPRQNSLDSLDRRRSYDRTASLPSQRKGSLLEHRSQRTERRLTRTQQPSRSPLNPQYFQALRGPVTSARGPQKSSTLNEGLFYVTLAYSYGIPAPSQKSSFNFTFLLNLHIFT